MKLAAANSIKPGATLARTIYSEHGSVLLVKGVKISRTMLDRLINQGITYVFIDDELTKDIYVEPVISEKTRSRASKTIEDTFLNISRNGLSETKSYLLNDKKDEFGEIADELINSIMSYGKSISLLADIYVSDNYIFQHSLNVAIYATSIGLKLKMPSEKLSELAVGAMLHDVGKIFIDPDILNKTGPLTEEEYTIMKTHAEIGYNYLRTQREYPAVIAHCAYQHHERLDGTGYPRGLKGTEIITPAKIIAIADVFDAVTSNRVYRKAMLPHEGLEMIYAGAASIFDTTMVEAFRKSIIAYPEGLFVVLSDGSEGVVIRQNKHLCDRPVIRIIKENGEPLDIPYEIDLGTKMNLTIKEVLRD